MKLLTQLTGYIPCLRHKPAYSSENFRKDLSAGVIVGLVAIPLALAFAIASGAKPEQGLYSAIMAGILIGVFGGSPVQIGGPTGAFVPLLFSIVTLYGMDNLLLAGFLAGILLILFGAAGLGTLIKFIPRPVTVGFTSGIAVLIFFGQIDTFLGLSGVVKHELFLDNLMEVLTHLPTFHLPTIIVALVGLFFLLFSRRMLPSIPGPLLAIAGATLTATLFFDGQVATIGSRFGQLTASLPAFHLPHLDWENIRRAIGPALTIALLGGVESLLSCVVADGMTGKRHNSNQELIGQGIANLVTPLFGGIPVTGAIARTATNVRNGGNSPVAAIVHSLTIIGLIALLAPWLGRIPLAGMAPILMVVAWNMSERKEFLHLLRTTKQDGAVLIITFALTVLVDLTTAVGIGLAMASILFIQRMSDVIQVEKVLPDHQARGQRVSPQAVNPLHDCPQIAIYTIEGALFFGAAEVFEKTLTDSIQTRPQVLLLRMGNVSVLDATAEGALRSVVGHFQKLGGTVLIAGLKSQPEKVLKKTKLYDMIGECNFFPRTGLAITHGLTLIQPQKCAGCKHKTFYECVELSAQQQVSA